MIVVIRMEVTDEERNALSLRSNPKALKRLATGNEIREHVEAQWREITQPESFIEEPATIADHTSAIPVIEIEKHGTGIIEEPANTASTPRGHLARLVLSINNAMHALTNAEMLSGMSCPMVTDEIAKIRRQAVELYGDAVYYHDQEAAKEVAA